MRTRLAVFFAVLLAAAWAQGQSVVQVVFPDASERQVWAADPAKPEPRDAATVATATTSVAAAKGQTLYALDAASGNLATVAAAKAKGRWEVAAGDFRRIGRVIVRVTYGGAGVAAAQVELKDAVRKQSGFLDPSSSGELSFYDVGPGKLEITVRTKSAGRDNPPVVQIAEVSLKRDKAVPVLDVAVPTEVATVAALAKPSAAAPAKTEERPSPAGQFAAYLVGLLLVGAVVYGALLYAKRNPEKVSDRLTQLGVQIPSAAEPEEDAVPPPPSAKPEPAPQIVLGDAAPAPMAPSVPPAQTGQPRLVAENGDVLDLEEGELTVGRDLGIGLSLPSESTVSRRHAALVRSGGEVVLRDLGSTNGTYVNGTKIAGDVALRPGDRVQFGAVRFRYEG